MKTRLTYRGYVALLLTVTGALYLMSVAVANPPPRAGGGTGPGEPPGPFTPTEVIDVEHAVDFPNDI